MFTLNTMMPASPTTKSLKLVMPVACMEVAVLPVKAGEVQFGLSYLPTIKFPVFAPASRSPATQFSVTLAVLKAMPELLKVQYRFTSLLAETGEEPIWECSDDVVVPVRLPPP